MNASTAALPEFATGLTALFFTGVGGFLDMFRVAPGHATHSIESVAEAEAFSWLSKAAH
jgi:hypothetical protein